MVFLAFAVFQRKAWMRNAYLFAVSLLFYYKTSGAFVGLLVLVTCSDFFIAQLIYKCKSLWMKRAWLTLSVCIDLGILCYFKYSYFFADILNQMLGTQIEVSNVAAKWLNGLTATSYFSVDKIILPVGISFYTFQIVSYTADVYKGLVKPVRNILDFGFYVSFFPQLVAGPIVKASDFIPQLYRKYFLSRRQFGIAIFWIVNGLIKKIVLSDYLAVNLIDRVFDVLATGICRLLWLHRYRHRPEHADGFPSAQKLQFAIQSTQLQQLLETLAHKPEPLVADLSVHPIGRKQDYRFRYHLLDSSPNTFGFDSEREPVCKYLCIGIGYSSNPDGLVLPGEKA